MKYSRLYSVKKITDLVMDVRFCPVENFPHLKGLKDL